ncbi:MAG: glycosyltransferase family 39 protein [Verrucomicrobia bacterium]|nr:glycosyltransferase family 39 protein [Verrucomicrobiota bacterium]
MVSPNLSEFLRDRRLWWLLATGLLAVVLAFVAIPDRQAITLVSHAGYWCVLAAFVLWGWSLWQSFSAEPWLRAWRQWDWASVAVVILGGCVLLAHEKFGFKIIMDEIMLLGTAMSMHLDKTVLTPLRGNDIQGAFMIVEGIVDKRPLFFPFLVSLLHDVTGYRPENAFVLNAVLTFLLLGLVCQLARRIAGRPAGWIAVALLAGLPLLGHNATGGGFELLNLVMIAATLLLGARYIEKRDGPALAALAFSGLLLAQVRYESVIYVLPVVLTVLWVWWQDGRAQISWPVILAPLLMVPYPLQHRIFDLRASAWEMFSKPGYTEPFSVAYIPENLGHALHFFFGKASDQPNSLVLSILGCLAAPFFFLLVAKRLRDLGRETPVNAAVAIFSLGFAVQFGLLMCYFWGKFDDPVIRRLSLPTHLGLVVAIVAVLPSFPRPAVARALLAMAGLGLIARSVPAMAAHAYSQEYIPGRETAWRREFMAAQVRPDYLMIDNDATLWITHLVSATPTVVAVKRREDIAFHLRNRTFSDVFVFQRYNIDPDSGKMTLRDGDDLGPAFVLEPVAERRLQLLTLSRISRVKAIRSGETVISAPDPVTAKVPKSRAEIDRARQQFLESYMKQLP